MREYLKSFSQQFKNLSKKLDKTSILIEKPWSMIDEDAEIQKLIFRKNKELILSKNGKVTTGNWDYFPEARSILIDRGTDKILCNEAFVNEGVLILKMDGTSNHFFMLANENLVPDLDGIKYLEQLRKKELNIFTRELINGDVLDIQGIDEYGNHVGGIAIGQPVLHNDKIAVDGRYLRKDRQIIYEIKNGKIHRILNRIEYLFTNNQILEILQSSPGTREKGDEVYINGKPAPDGKYNFGLFNSIKVKNGRIV